MAIRFPPELHQPPPHYTSGPRCREVATERAVVRAIVHPDAVRIATPAPLAPRLAGTAQPPHRIAFARIRPPPGTTTVTPPPPRATVRAIVHPDAALPARARDPVERRISQATAPHRISFGAAIARPR